MLRWNQTRRFALLHSPTREQREVMFAKDGDIDKLLNTHASDRGEEKSIDSIRNETHQSIEHVIPPEISERDAGMIVRAIELYGSPQLIAKLQGEQTNEAKLHVLMRDPETALSVATMMNARRVQFEETVERIEKRLKNLFEDIDEEQKKIDVAAKEQNDKPVSSKLLLEVQAFIKRMKEEGISGTEEIERIIQRISPEKTERYEGLDVKKITEALFDVLEIVRGKNVFNAATMENEGEGTMPGSEYSDTATARFEKMQYADYLLHNEHTALNIITRSIQEKKNKLWETYREQWNEAADLGDEEMIERYGVTVEGFQKAFLRQTSSIREIFPGEEKVEKEEKEEDSSDEPFVPKTKVDKITKQLLKARAVLETLKSVERQSLSENLGDAPWLKFLRVEEEAKEQLASKIVSAAERARARIEEHPIRNKESGYKTLQEINAIIQHLGGANHIGLSLDPALRAWIRTTPQRELERILRKMEMLSAAPELVEKIQLSTAEVSTRTYEEKSERDAVLDVATESVEKILKHCSHNICDVLEIPKELQLRLKIVQANIKMTVSDRTTAKEKKDAWRAAQIDSSELRSAADLMSKLHDRSNIHIVSGIEYHALGYQQGTRATFDPATSSIYVNEDACDPDEIQDVIEHEQAHQIIDILSRKTNVCPYLIGNVGDRIRSKAADAGWSNDAYEALVSKLATLWKCNSGSKQDDRFSEELLVRYADWKAGRRQSLKDDEKKLYDLIESIPKDEKDSEGQSMEMYSIVEQDGEGEEDEDGNKVKIGSEERDYSHDLGTLEKAIKNFDNFFDTWKNAGTAESAQMLADLKEGHRTLREKMLNGEDISAYEKTLDICLKAASDMDEAIRKFDEHQRSISTNTPSKKKGWKNLVSGINWMSISDIGIMFREAGEDIQRMWKRRGEGVRATVGKKIFGAIPHAIPYLGRIESEFAGREQSSEQEEVGVWEKRYETVDSRTLLYDILPRSSNKDEIKAIMNLLTKRGRMDWNFEGLWDALESVSDYHIPHAECIRDPLLRDVYLQKLCANIWGDKGQFTGWKNANDSGIESGKNGYQGTIDTLSGTSNGLASRARELLAQQMRINQGVQLLPHEELDPHLYEGIIHYAMRNGKMSMEDKIFYLIQGVAHGLITIDRLKAMYGEQGGVLNSFPVIDFFNGKTHADIMRLASEIGYPTAAEPDIRTTHLLMNEIRNDTGTRDRTQKGLREPQKWDHEDMPMFISMMDHNGIDALIAPVSGSTSKISKPGMKNIYVGYNTVMQYFAVRAKMAKEHGAPFSDQDAAQCATLLAAYANFDNRVSIPAKLSERPTLSANDMNDCPVSSGGAHKTSEYRDRMVDFIHQIGSTFSLNSAGDMSLDSYVRRHFEDAENIKYDQCNKASPVFDRQLKSVFKGNKQKLIDLLASMADKKGKEGGFIPEKEAYTYENVKEIVR